MISVAEATQVLLAMARLTAVEMVPLSAARGRVLAQDVAASRTQPPWDASAMDGYAVRAIDAAPGAALRVVGETPAGAPPAPGLNSGEAVRVFTGAPTPPGADRVVIQEDVARQGDAIIINESPDSAAYIRRAGLDFQAGTQLLTAPRELTARDIALAAAGGATMLAVRRRPRVAIIATGDELVWPGDPAQDRAIVTSNNFGLAALVEAAGGAPELTPLCPDSAPQLAAVLTSAAQADLIVTLGGASVGDHDLIAPTLRDLGAQTAFHKVRMRPGKPLLAARLGETPVIGLPGNPVSAMVCGALFVAPFVRRMLGAPDAVKRGTASLGAPLPAGGAREHFMRGLRTESGVAPLEDQDSSRLRLLAAADVLIVRPAHAPAAAPGEVVEIIQLS